VLGTGAAGVGISPDDGYFATYSASASRAI
jgi:hypothetical protein